MTEYINQVQLTLKLLLSAGKPYVIPRYQRHFAWGVKEAEELFEDIDSTDTSLHNFLGTMILKEHKEKIEVVDGQQRLTVLSLLLIAIRNKAVKITNGGNLANAMSGYIVFKDDNGDENGFRIYPSEKIDTIFRHLASPEWDKKDPEDQFPDKIDNKQIKRQVKKIQPIFKSFEESLEDFTLEQLQKFNQKVLNSYFYTFRVSNDEESMQLFERINARGKHLEVSDLIKTYLFQKTHPNIEELWNSVEEVAGESPTKLLKHFYYTQGGHVTKASLFAKIKKLEPEDNLLKNLIDFSRFYKGANITSSDANSSKNDLREYINLQDSDWLIKNEAKFTEYFSSLISLKSFGVTQHLPLAYGMLNAAIKVHSLNPDKHCYDILLKLTKNIEHYHFANTAICQQGGNKVETLYAGFAMEFTQLSTKSDCTDIKFRELANKLNDKLSSKFVNLTEFTQAFIKNLDDSDDLIFYVFDRLNNRDLEKKRSLTYDQERTDIYRPFEKKIHRKLYTIEHIFPQNPRQPPTLQLIPSIGNLVIIKQGDNSKLSNKLPKDKFEYIKNNLTLTQFKLPMITELLLDFEAKVEGWDDILIEQRAKLLAEVLYSQVLTFNKFK